MRNKILAIIATLWGGAIIIETMVQGLPKGNSSFAIGTYGGKMCGVLLFIGGVHYLLKKSNASA